MSVLESVQLPGTTSPLDTLYEDSTDTGSFLHAMDAMEGSLNGSMDLNHTMDTTTNISRSHHIRFYQYRNEQLVFQSLLFLFILVSNIAVLVAIGMSKRGRTSKVNFFIMHLALADISVGLFSVSTDIIGKLTYVWYAGNIMCKLVRYMQSVALYASTFVLVALSLDRLDAIARPMSFSGSGVRAKVLVASAWGLSFAFSVPMLVINRESLIGGAPQCWISFAHAWHWQLYISLIAVALFLLPAIIIVVCYVIIIRIIWSKSQQIQTAKRVTNFRMSRVSRFSYKNDRETEVNGSGKTENVPVSAASSSRGVIPMAKVKTIKMTFVIVLMFILCWSPYFIFNVCDVFGLIPLSQNKVTISIFIQTLAPLNSAANPVIYGLFSSRVCKNLRRIPMCNCLARRLCGCCVHERRRTERATSMYSTYTTINPDTSIKRHVRPLDARTDGGCRRWQSESPTNVKDGETETAVLMSNSMQADKNAAL